MGAVLHRTAGRRPDLDQEGQGRGRDGRAAPPGSGTGRHLTHAASRAAPEADATALEVAQLARSIARPLGLNEDLVEAIRSVAAGHALLAPEVTRRVIRRFAGSTGVGYRPDLVAGLTDREREVLTLVAQGLSNGEIAARLVLGEATVKTHVRNVLAKLELSSRAQIVVFAYEHRLVTG